MKQKIAETKKALTYDIKKRAEEKGLLFSRLADDLNVGRDHVSGVIHFRNRSKRVEEALCIALDLNYDEYWGLLYRLKREAKNAL